MTTGDSVAAHPRIGQTPLVRLRAFEPAPGVEIYAKLESQNAAGSVKDRAAKAIVDDAERRGELDPGRVLLDATSGNTGISYAMIGAARGFLVELCVPANVTPERKRLLRAYGADVALTDPMEGSDGAIAEARRRFAERPDLYFYADQYNNESNWQAHFAGTGQEILDETQGRVTHFVAGLGTTGTFVGVGRRLRASIPGVHLVSVQPDSPLHGLEGLKHLPSAIVPGIYDPRLADANVLVATEDAHVLTRRLAREAGLYVGPSSGAALAGVLRIARDLREGVLVTVFPDGGARYASEPFWASDDGELAVPASVRAAVHAHGVEAFPDECCGVLVGREAGRVTAAWPFVNTTSLDRQRRFLIGPDDYRKAEARASREGVEILGFYHSHPNHPAEPSAFDLDHAWPNFSYLIVSIRDRVPREMRSWRLRADRSGYHEETIVPGVA
jgi:cysteine synthase B